jgi:hypothetical protein
MIVCVGTHTPLPAICTHPLDNLHHNATGKLPVGVDMDSVPQTTEPEIESPPPIPPKMDEIASFDAPQNGPVFGFNHSAKAIMLSREDNSAPVLPPKPK